MSEIVTYKNDGRHCYCQIRLDSGERILISGAQGQIKILRLVFGWLFPRGTVWESRSAAEIIEKFVDRSKPVRHPLDAAVESILRFGSIEDLKRALSSQ